MPLKLVMMGTGHFAVPAFRALYETPHEVVGLYTQPDRQGRGKHHHVNPMKEVALAYGTPVFQPEKINTPDELAQLAGLGADLFVVAAYGQILSRALLKIPPRGSINIHASLLPKYRGAAPINYAIANGEAETGVCIIEIQPALDAGPVMGSVRTPIGPTETTGDLEPRLAELAVPLLKRVLDEIAAGTETRVPQDDHLATFAPKMTKSMGEIDWRKTPEEIDCHVRAMQPWPTPVTYLYQAGRSPVRFVVRSVSPLKSPAETAKSSSRVPGEVVHVDKSSLQVQTGQGLIEIEQIQPEGKRPMAITAFLNGYVIRSGDRFGPAEGTFES